MSKCRNKSVRNYFDMNHGVSALPTILLIIPKLINEISDQYILYIDISNISLHKNEKFCYSA